MHKVSNPSRRPLAACGLAVGLLTLLFIVMSEERTRQLALNSLWLATGTITISLPIGIGLAILIVRTDVPGRNLAALLLA